MDLAGDGGILPFDFSHFPRLDIDGFQFGVREIALVLQLPEIVAAALGQAVNVDMAPLVAYILPDGVCRALYNRKWMPEIPLPSADETLRMSIPEKGALVTVLRVVSPSFTVK